MRKFPISARHVACMYIGSADSSKFPLLILTPNCLLTYFVTHRQYFHLIVNKMYVFLRKFPISARHVACMYIGSADSSKFPLLILTPNCLLTYFVTHRQYFHLIVNKMYVFLGIIYAIYELFNLTN